MSILVLFPSTDAVTSNYDATGSRKRIFVSIRPVIKHAELSCQYLRSILFLPFTNENEKSERWIFMGCCFKFSWIFYGALSVFTGWVCFASRRRFLWALRACVDRCYVIESRRRMGRAWRGCTWCFNYYGKKRKTSWGFSLIGTPCTLRNHLKKARW